MKQVTFKGAKDGSEYGAVRIAGVEYPLDEAVIVSDSEAKAVEALRDEYSFTVTQAPEGAKRTTEQDQPEQADSGGFGGTQTPDLAGDTPAEA